MSSFRALTRSVPPLFLPLGLLARLPYAMTPLATLLVLQPESHTFAGLAAGAQSVAIAVGGLAAGGLAVRVGARRLGTVLAVLNALAVVALLLASGRPAMLASAVLIGLFQPHAGLLVRLHWSSTFGRSPLLHKAFAYESAADEVSFVLGPVAVGLLAVWASGPLLGMAALLLGAALPLASHYSHAAVESPVRATLPLFPMALLVIGMASVGAVFGSVQTAVAAQSGGGAGFLYACLGVGSAVSSLAYALLPEAFGPRARHLVFGATLVAGMALLKLGQHTDLIVPGILAAGVFVAPYMITLYSRAAAVAPPSRLPVAMAVLGAGGPIGTAIGQAVTGKVLDMAGLAPAWLVPLGCAVPALLVAVLDLSRSSSR